MSEEQIEELIIKHLCKRFMVSFMRKQKGYFGTTSYYQFWNHNEGISCIAMEKRLQAFVLTYFNRKCEIYVYDRTFQVKLGI